MGPHLASKGLAYPISSAWRVPSAPHLCQHLVLIDEHFGPPDALEAVVVHFRCQLGWVYSGCFSVDVSGREFHLEWWTLGKAAEGLARQARRNFQALSSSDRTATLASS